MYAFLKSIVTFPSTFALTLTLAVGGCGDDLAREARSSAPEAIDTPAELGFGDDWYPVEDGLWTRLDESGEQEFLGLGAAGKAHALAGLEAVEAQLAVQAAEDDTEEARRQLAEIQDFIAEYRTAPVAEPSEDAAPRCSLVLKHTVSAYPIPCGVAASASVEYSHPCSSVQETVKTYTKATCGYSTTTHQCGPKTGNPVSCSSYSQITGPAPCDSYALAQTNYYATWKANTTRGACYSDPGGTGGNTGLCGTCPSGKDCHCGDVCRPVGSICP